MEWAQTMVQALLPCPCDQPRPTPSTAGEEGLRGAGGFRTGSSQTREREGTERVAFLTWEWQDQPQVVGELPEQVIGAIGSPWGLKKLDLQ